MDDAVPAAARFERLTDEQWDCIQPERFQIDRMTEDRDIPCSPLVISVPSLFLHVFSFQAFPTPM